MFSSPTAETLTAQTQTRPCTSFHPLPVGSSAHTTTLPGTAKYSCQLLWWAACQGTESCFYRGKGQSQSEGSTPCCSEASQVTFLMLKTTSPPWNYAKGWALPVPWPEKQRANKAFISKFWWSHHYPLHVFWGVILCILILWDLLGTSSIYLFLVQTAAILKLELSREAGAACQLEVLGRKRPWSTGTGPMGMLPACSWVRLGNSRPQNNKVSKPSWNQYSS